MKCIMETYLSHQTNEIFWYCRVSRWPKRLSPSLLGLQRMLNIIKAFSTSTALTFKSKKTRCIKWYSHVKHLGHIFNCCVNFSTDVAYRKRQFIVCIITQFVFSHPLCKLKLLVTYGYSFYGSPLWDLYDNDSKIYILLETLQYANYMICLWQPIHIFWNYSISKQKLEIKPLLGHRRC